MSHAGLSSLGCLPLHERLSHRAWLPAAGGETSAPAAKPRGQKLAGGPAVPLTLSSVPSPMQGRAGAAVAVRHCPARTSIALTQLRLPRASPAPRPFRPGHPSQREHGGLRSPPEREKVLFVSRKGDPRSYQPLLGSVHELRKTLSGSHGRRFVAPRHVLVFLTAELNRF